MNIHESAGDYLALDGQLAGFFALADTLHPEAAGMLQEMRRAGKEPVPTGDHANAACHIAGQLSVGEFRAACLPEAAIRL